MTMWRLRPIHEYQPDQSSAITSTAYSLTPPPTSRTIRGSHRTSN